MATVNKIVKDGSIKQEVTPVTLTGTDDFLASTGMLFVNNTGGSNVTITLLGDGVTDPANATQCGLGNVATGSGYQVTVTAGVVAQIRLASISAFVAGTTVALTGGTADCTAWIIE